MRTRTKPLAQGNEARQDRAPTNRKQFLAAHTTVTVLGCSGAIASGQRTTSFLVGQNLLVDAGTGVGDLSLEALGAIDHVLLTHSHLDHIASLPLLADTVLRLRRDAQRPPIQVYALPETLQALRDHIFNGVIWPDFTRLPTAQAPVLAFQPLAVGQCLRLAGLTAQVLPATHTVAAVGYALWPGEPESQACWVFTGDTGPNAQLWEALAGHRVAQIIIETAFPDAEQTVAEHSKHLHPAALARELNGLASDVQVYITHIKPGDAAAIEADLISHGLRHRVQMLTGGERLQLGA